MLEKVKKLFGKGGVVEVPPLPRQFKDIVILLINGNYAISSNGGSLMVGMYKIYLCQKKKDTFFLKFGFHNSDVPDDDNNILPFDNYSNADMSLIQFVINTCLPLIALRKMEYYD